MSAAGSDLIRDAHRADHDPGGGAKPNNYGINLENYGVPPDVWVENSPMDELKRFDRELKVAVDEAKKMMKAEPPKVV